MSSPAAGEPAEGGTGRPAVVLQPSRGLSSLNLGQVWAFRELLYFFVWRDLKVRYKQTVFGAAWAIVQPLVTALIFTVVFSVLARIPSDGIPYPIFAFSALLPWTYFARSLERVSNSVVESANLLSKIFFPRLVIPLSAVFSGLVDVAFAFLPLVGLMAYYRVTPSHGVWLLPLFLLLSTTTALGIGLWLSALNVRFRDVKYVSPFLVQIWMYASPVIYPVSLVPERFRPLYWLNPMVGVIEGFRWAILGSFNLEVSLFALSALVSVAVLVSGAFYFRRMERTFADVI